jgi:hypothetical protein
MSDSLYGQILDTFLALRDTRERFKTYSAKDIKQLISSKMKSVREPAALRELYKLEEMISKLRASFTEAKVQQNALAESESKEATDKVGHISPFDEEIP